VRIQRISIDIGRTYQVNTDAMTAKKARTKAEVISGDAEISADPVV
jgi:hypothetical protein